MTLAARTRLGHYEVLSRIGAGGMGEVYRAHDAKLDRDVAIKVLPESVASDAEALARFEREAKAVAALSHPNVLAIHDFGRQDGVVYAVMELLDGATLRARLQEGPIPLRRGLEYALQIARGLTAAHEKGIVHRDLKPENIFIGRDGHVKILDFGLARRTGKAAPGQETSAPTDTAFTSPGTVMGTVGYMSPEQVRGQAVDQRSDIFSFGSVLYEVFSGAKPFQRDTVADTMAAILKEEPPELAGSGRDVPPGLDHIVRHCLEKDPKDRFQSARDVAFALSEASSGPGAVASTTHLPKSIRPRVFAAAAVVATLAAGGWLLRGRGHTISPPMPAPSDLKRIAVLPFDNLGSASDDYFADGIADAVRGKLTSVRGIEVIARASSILYKKTTKTPQQIAGELGVPYLLTATVRWQGSGGSGRVQVSPELVEVRESGAPASRWQQPFDAALTDVFQVQSDIAARVVESLDVALGAGDERKIHDKPTENLAAYEAFLRGDETWKTSAGWNLSLGPMIGFFERAVALDPSFAPAWARLSQARSHLYDQSPSPQLAEAARLAAEKARALRPNSPEAQLALGDYYAWIRNDKKTALYHVVLGLAQAPDNTELLMARAILEDLLGHEKLADDSLRRAERLDPRSIEPKALLASDLMFQDRIQEARAVIDRGLAVEPANIGLIHQKAETFLLEGDLAGARAVIEAAPEGVEPTELVANFANFDDLVWVLDKAQRELLLRLPPSAFPNGNQGVWGICLAQACWLDGDRAKTRQYAEIARRSFQEAVRAAPDNGEHHAFLGLSLAYLGRKAEALREGERGVALGMASELYYRLQLARIDVLVGEPEKAIDNLERIRQASRSILSPGWLRIDPNFDSLRTKPRFQKLTVSAR